MVRIATTVQLTEQQKSELTGIAQSRALPAGYVFRAKLIVMLNDGATFAAIRERLGPPTRRSFVGKSAFWLPESTVWIPPIQVRRPIG